MNPALPLTVVVPVHNAARLLSRSLTALEVSDLPRELWELIVVDDASTDGSALVAERHADRVIRLVGLPQGPASARNHGVEAARGEVVGFVDADVIVHRDTLGRMVEALASDRGVAAVFGAYDETPEAAGFISQYRNLLHRYVHLAGAGEADTFWAGCGAVRRQAFLDAGGFDAAAFPRPQIEDIELGYRLRDQGWRIVLDPGIQGTHLKRWTLWGMLRTDVTDRGIPWMRLMLRRGPGGVAGALNVRWQEKLKTAMVGSALLLATMAAVLHDPRWLWAAVAALSPVLVGNLHLYRWFARLRGWGFALGVVPMNVLYYALNGGCVAVAWSLHIRDRFTGRKKGLLPGSRSLEASATPRDGSE